MKTKYARFLVPLIFMAADYTAIVAAENLALWLRNWNVVYRIPSAYIYIWVPLIFFVFLASSRIYTKMQPLLDSVRQVFSAVIYGVVSCIVLLFLFKESIALSRLYAILFAIFRNGSVWIDLMYLVKTVKAVFFRKGAY